MIVLFSELSQLFRLTDVMSCLMWYDTWKYIMYMLLMSFHMLSFLFWFSIGKGQRAKGEWERWGRTELREDTEGDIYRGSVLVWWLNVGMNQQWKERVKDHPKIRRSGVTAVYSWPLLLLPWCWGKKHHEVWDTQGKRVVLLRDYKVVCAVKRGS